MTTQALTVSFHGSDLFIVEHDGQPYTPMKPIVEGMGMDWASQFVKLKADEKRWGVVKITIPTLGNMQEAICLPLRKLAGWLMTISPNKVKPELRDTIIMYQNECDDVLWNYWNQRTQPTPTEPPRLTHATKQQREPLVSAVRRLVKVAQSKNRPITYDQAHSIINLKMGVSGIEDMTPEQIPQAMTLVGELLERVVLSGEYLAKPDAPEQIPAPSHTFQHVPLDQITNRFDVFFRNDPYWSKLSKMSMIVITSVAWNTLRGTLNDDDLCFLNSAMSHLTIPRAHPLDRLAGQIAESLEKQALR